MILKHTYTFFSLFYDEFFGALTEPYRKRSLESLPQSGERLRIFLNGIGTGLDIPFLPRHHQYVGLDLTPAMLKHAQKQLLAPTSPERFQCLCGDAQKLPLADASFDYVVLHLIIAVVPDPVACLQESVRVLKPGGTILIFDKFLQPEWKRAPFLRLINPVTKRLATRFDVILEDLLATTPSLELLDNQPALFNGWSRLLRLIKNKTA